MSSDQCRNWDKAFFVDEYVDKTSLNASTVWEEEIEDGVQSATVCLEIYSDKLQTF